MKHKKILSLLLAMTIVCTPTAVHALTVQADNTVRTYNGEFTDLSSSAWYYNDVVAAYSLGLLNGKTGTTFAPDQSLNIAETIKLAAVCHQYLSNGAINDNAFVSANSSHWYDGYVSYCIKNGIVTEDYEDYTAAASRAQAAILFSRAIISSGASIEEINQAAFGELPDVSTEMWYAGAVYRMYRWGILTGDTNGNLNPESRIKRSEIATILMRMIDETKRMKVGGQSPSGDSPAKDENNPPAEETPSTSVTTPTISSLTLYEGSRDNKSFTGITGFAGQFTVSDAVPTTNAAYSLDLINSLVLENDCISFRLYTGAGFEALGIVRGWLNEAARGKDGAAVNDKADVYAAINELCYLWVNGKRLIISEMWYADHGDYTTYAFYFNENVNPGTVKSLDIMVGRVDSDTLIASSMTDLAAMVEEADKEGVILPDPDDAPDTLNDTYKAAIADAKDTAAEVLFEYETERCTILYGRGLYGRESNEYRLLFIFKDGTTQTVAAQKIEDIRMNAAGDVLYYNLTGPDGKVLQYGINFGE